MFEALATYVLFAAVFSACAAQSKNDNPLDEKVKQIIQNVDNYLEDHNLDHTDLPNIGILPLDPLKLRNGKFGKFSTIEVQDIPFVNKSDSKDGSTVYNFDVKLGLKEFQFQYDFTLNAMVYNQKGHFSLAPQQNSAEVSGVAVVHSDKSCEAQLGNIQVVHYGDFKVDLQPNDIPQATEVSQQILNFVTPMVMPITNKVLEL